jgi:N-sulfoglucosamine sulfohydrolase
MYKLYYLIKIVDDFVSLNDFTPTFLELAGVEIPDDMNAKSFFNILESEDEGFTDPARNFVVMRRERHTFVRKNRAV